MTERPASDPASPQPARPRDALRAPVEDARATRLKAALKANLARRKAQTRARSDDGAHRPTDIEERADD